MNELSIIGGPFDVKSLRCACSDYADVGELSVCNSKSGKTFQVTVEVTVAGWYGSISMHEYTNFESCVAHIQLLAEETLILNSRPAVWGRPDIEGCMLCQKYGIQLHVVEKNGAHGQEVIGHKFIEVE
jgi:hypothetical protein